jgi:hypothetical protein
VQEIAFLPDALKIPESEGHGSGGQLLSSLPPAVVDDLAPALALHARPKAMCLLSFQVVGLKRSFHRSTSFWVEVKR